MFFFRRDIFATIKEIEVTIQRLVLMGILRLSKSYCVIKEDFTWERDILCPCKNEACNSYGSLPNDYCEIIIIM